MFQPQARSLRPSCIIVSNNGSIRGSFGAISAVVVSSATTGRITERKSQNRGVTESSSTMRRPSVRVARHASVTSRLAAALSPR